MKTTTLTALFLISCAMALMGCGGDGTGTPDGDLDPDVVENETTEADTHLDTDRDATVCDENGVCCDGYQCCKNNHCWAQYPDTLEDDSTVDGEVEPDGNTPQTTFCTEDSTCTFALGQDYWCDKYHQHCRPNSELALIEPYLDLEGEWKCIEGSAFDESFTLEILGWDEEELTAKASGILSDTIILTFKDNGGIMTLVSMIDQGGYEWLNPQYDNATHQISFDWYEDGFGTTHWVFKRQ